MNKYVKRSLQIGIPLALAAWIIIPRIGGDGVQSKQNTPGNMGKGRLPVTGIIAKNSVVAAGFPVNGSLLANEEVDLVAEIVGKVRKIYFQEGVAVKKGQLLLKESVAVRASRPVIFSETPPGSTEPANRHRLLLIAAVPF